MKVTTRAPQRLTKTPRTAATSGATPAPAEKSSGWTPKAAKAVRAPLAPSPSANAGVRGPGASGAVAPVKPLWVPPTQGQWTVDAHGVRSDAVNLYVHGDLGQVKQALTQAGWIEAKQNTSQNNLAYLEAVPQHEANRLADALGNACESLWYRLTGKKINLDVKDSSSLQQAIDTMPVSKQTLDGGGNLSSFELHNDPLGGRDHLRIFDTGKVDGQGKPVWAIAASRDTGIKLDKNRPEQGFLNHAVEANTDLERDTVLGDLQKTGLIGDTRKFGVDFGKTAAEASGVKPQDGQVFDLVLR